jgi:hypothetical protein
MPEVSEVAQTATKSKATLTPALSRRERGLTEVSRIKHRPERPSRLGGRDLDEQLAEPAKDSAMLVQVGVVLQYSPIGPLSLWERARVRGF